MVHLHFVRPCLLAWRSRQRRLLLLSLMLGALGCCNGRREHLRPRNDRRNIRPNIILVLTDDQDVELGSMDVMDKTRQIMEQGGTHFANAFVTTPMCCPSRSSILTGKYTHNHHVYTNNENCSSPFWQATHEPHTFGAYLSRSGYRTGYFGKYLNEYNGTYVPPGWLEWAGLVRNSRFYNYTISRNGIQEKHGFVYEKDYLTDLITNDSIRFFRKSKDEFPLRPVLMVLSHAAPHGPEDSAPQYADKFPNVSQHITPSYNFGPNYDKHWFVSHMQRMLPIHMEFTNILQRKRLQTLLSVDDSVEKIFQMLQDTGELDNTYIIFTADHGYHVGQFGLVKGKSLPYEFDIRVPFYMRGPEIQPGTRVSQPVLNIDLAPTMLDIAGLKAPGDMDGKSVLKLVLPRRLNSRKQNHWRNSFLIERGKMFRLKQVGNKGLYTLIGKSDRMREVCERPEFQTACQQSKQKWQCVEDPDGRLRLQKCKPRSQSGVLRRVKNPALPTLPMPDDCICPSDPSDPPGGLSKTERRNQRKFLKIHLTQKYKPRFIGTRPIRSARRRPRRRRSRWVGGNWRLTKRHHTPTAWVHKARRRRPLPPASRSRKKYHREPSLKVTRRCSILSNSTIRCDGHLYSSIKAWKHHKSKIEDQIEDLQVKIKSLKEVKGHLKTKRPDKCDCIKSYSSKKRSLSRQKHKTVHPFKGQSRATVSPWLQQYRLEKRRKKVKKTLKKMKRGGDCKAPGITCFTHTNEHWQTPPFWTLGTFCACTSASNSTYWCVRTLNTTHNTLFCEFATSTIEYYDLDVDPYQLRNTASLLPTYLTDWYMTELQALRSCRGHKQCNPSGRPATTAEYPKSTGDELGSGWSKSR
uniref:Sulfatase 1 n=1 Tax=Eptatretus burgeri TaxID=7764 RepID=A0A8C4PYC1_EPTBU